MQVPALVFERASDDRRGPRGAGSGLAGAACTAATCVLQDLQIVQPSERVLRALDGPQRRRRRLHAGVGRQLQRVAQLLRGNAAPGAASRAHRCWPASSIAARSAFGRFSSRGAERARATSSDWLCASASPTVRQPPVQLLDVDPLEPLEHHGPRRSSRSATTWARTSSSASRGQRFGGGELVDELQRHVQLADGAERPASAADFAARLARLAALEPDGQHRHALRAAAARRRAPGARRGRRRRRRAGEMALERARRGVQQQASVTRVSRRFMVGLRTDRQKRPKTGLTWAGPPVYNGHVTNGEPAPPRLRQPRPHAHRRHRHRHQLHPHDRGPGPAGPVVRGHRPRKGHGPARRRRPRRPQPDAHRDGRRAPDAVEVQAAGRVAQGRRDRRRGHQRDPRSRKRRRLHRRGRSADRHPHQGDLRHRGSAAHPPRRRLRRRHRRHHRRRRRHRRRQRRDHARHGDAPDARPQLQGRRHPADRALRQERSAQRRRRAPAGQAPQHARWAATSTRSPARASIASSARPARS